MNDVPRALSLKVEQTDGAITVELVGHSARARQVSYELEVSGRSNSRHRGSTMLAANTPVRLSTMTASVGESWCVRLLAEEEGGDPYEILAGDCPEAET
ncbi:curli-like amyloid fiber formation chaperone CsgH [Erythrobacter dokdonensis]|uniref:Uncharacterized protein n=1 Tax=Erythrobacter dokdonensis DSW-74 TaxID=1300349 RepID=A0A1A7BCF5_9SPHN|nr:curli-like amyloid fiber formation chaperone CsgH [Erythrobacter dokdonensis]OBV10208.1 hypothetical protein I603_2170 [Erythrobacter dokdonensis DSW-74]